MNKPSSTRAQRSYNSDLVALAGYSLTPTQQLIYLAIAHKKRGIGLRDLTKWFDMPGTRVRTTVRILMMRGLLMTIGGKLRTKAPIRNLQAANNALDHVARYL